MSSRSRRPKASVGSAAAAAAGATPTNVPDFITEIQISHIPSATDMLPITAHVPVPAPARRTAASAATAAAMPADDASTFHHHQQEIKQSEYEEEKSEMCRARMEQAETESESLNVYRQKVIDRLCEISTITLDIARRIERSLFEYSMTKADRHQLSSVDFSCRQFRTIYGNHFYHLLVNIDPTSYLGSSECLTRIQSGIIDIDRIASLPPNELNPQLCESVLTTYRAKQELLDSKQRERITSLYTCSRCRKNEHSFFEMQTRSCDEPMTSFYTCLNCGHKWSS